MTTSPFRFEPLHGSCAIRLIADGARASWIFRSPEALSCNEGVFKIHDHPMSQWHGPEADGSLWHEWETNDADFAVISRSKFTEPFGLKFIQGARFIMHLTPMPDGVALSLSVTNTGSAVLHAVVNSPCLAAENVDFHDPRLERTFINTERGLTALCTTDRGTGDPIRTHYPVAGKPAIRFYAPPFWGEASKTVATGGAVVRVSADGKRAVGFSWERVSEIWNNEDNHHCVHSCGLTGDLQPGETREVRGRIVLVTGGAVEAMQALRAGCDERSR